MLGRMKQQRHVCTVAAEILLGVAFQRLSTSLTFYLL